MRSDKRRLQPGSRSLSGSTCRLRNLRGGTINLEPIFVSTNITKRYGQTIALNNVDIAIYPGEIRGFIGENGSGKSTMGSLMTGIHEPTGGSMYFHGKEWKPTSMIDALEHGIGIIVQEIGTIPQISVAENMYLGELANFSGTHFFEEKKVENFSASFDRDILKAFDEKADPVRSAVTALRAEGEFACFAAKRQLALIKKDTFLSVEEKAAKTAELTAELQAAKERMAVNKPRIAALIKEAGPRLKQVYTECAAHLAKNAEKDLAAQVEAYNTASREAFEAFRKQLAELEDRFAAQQKDASIPEDERKYLKPRYDNDVKEAKEAYAARIARLDRQHEMFVEWQKGDSRSLKNHYANFLAEIGSGSADSLGAKVKNAAMNAVFGLFVNSKKLYKYAQHDLYAIGANHILAQIPCGAYDMQDRKLIEIAKCLRKDPEIFIVDETTTALSETGRNLLYRLMNEMKARGKSVLFVSHDLDEIMEKCDTLTVLRDGNIVANLSKEKNEFDPDVIRKAMIGRELKGDYYRSDYDGSFDPQVVLKMVDGIEGSQLRHVNLELHKGEILGIGGLSDCGMHTLGKALFGNVRMEGGYVFTGEKLDLPVTNEVTAMKYRIGYLPKNRDTEGLSQNDSIFNNIAIASINKVAKMGTFVFKSAENKVVNREVHDLSIKCNSATDLVSSLSGGNKQKVSLAKWIGNDSEILILDCPTRGVDIGVKQFIYQLIYKMKKEGKSILLISEELPELIGMSDRILIMKDGVVSKEFTRDPGLTQEQIVQYMI